MLQSKRNFVIGVIGLIIIVPFLISHFGSMLDTSENEYKGQTLDEFKTKYIDEQELETTNQKLNYFKDTTGYTPQWAKDIGNNQALQKCMSIVMDDFMSREGKWCGELSGFMMDQMSP